MIEAHRGHCIFEVEGNGDFIFDDKGASGAWHRLKVHDLAPSAVP
jgi:hypothetical protein